MSDLFASAAGSGVSNMACTYVEVYNDQCNDLLGGTKRLALREGTHGAPYVDGLVQERVASLDEAMEALSKGNARRTVAQMKMNQRSSRGHAVFTLEVTSGGRSGKLVLVDLAGMESSKKSYAVEGASSAPQRREEARHINTSLYALGTVIERLSSAARAPPGAVSAHIPFRDAKLTRLLQDCMQSGTVAFVVTLRAEPSNLDECAATLRFAQRARAVPVVVRPHIEALAQDPAALQLELKAVTKELAQAKALIERLQRETLAERRGGAGGARQAQAQETTEEARESQLRAGRLQLGQLAEQMSELVEQTRAVQQEKQKQQQSVASAPAFSWPWSRQEEVEETNASDELHQQTSAVALQSTADRPGTKRKAKATARGGGGVETERASMGEDASAAAAVKEAIEQAKAEGRAAKAAAAEAVRREQVRAAKAVRAAQAAAEEERRRLEAEKRDWREKAAVEADKRTKSAIKAASALEQAEQKLTAAEARAVAAEKAAAEERLRAERAEAAATAASEGFAKAATPGKTGARAHANAPAADAAVPTADVVASPPLSPSGEGSASSRAAARRLQRAQQRGTFVDRVAEDERLAQLHNLAQEELQQIRELAGTLEALRGLEHDTGSGGGGGGGGGGGAGGGGSRATGTVPYPGSSDGGDGTSGATLAQSRISLHRPSREDYTCRVRCPRCSTMLQFQRHPSATHQDVNCGACSATFVARYTYDDGDGRHGGRSVAGAPPPPSSSFTPRTAAVLEVSEREAKQLAELQGLFPALPQSELRAALEQYGWNVNRAACELMDDLGLQ